MKKTLGLETRVDTVDVFGNPKRHRNVKVPTDRKAAQANGGLPKVPQGSATIDKHIDNSYGIQTIRKRNDVKPEVVNKEGDDNGNTE